MPLSDNKGGVMQLKRFNISTHPDLCKFSLPILHVRPTAHAVKRAEEKGISIPDYLKVDGFVVELESYGRTVTKLVIRIPQSHGWDFVYVLAPNVIDKCWTLVTCWKNHESDQHSTLDLKRISA